MDLSCEREDVDRIGLWMVMADREALAGGSKGSRRVGSEPY